MNWYKTAQSVDDITQIAYKVRQSLMQDDEDSLKSLCLPVSRHLAQVFINKGFTQAHVVQGTFTIDDPDPSATEDWDVGDFGDGSGGEDAYEEMESATYTPLHYWVQLGNTVVDITADQFNDELDDPVSEVEIGDINSMERYTVIQENFIEPKIMYEWARI